MKFVLAFVLALYLATIAVANPAPVDAPTAAEIRQELQTDWDSAKASIQKAIDDIPSAAEVSQSLTTSLQGTDDQIVADGKAAFQQAINENQKLRNSFMNWWNSV